MAAEKSDILNVDKAAQDTTLQRWIERVLWKNFRYLRNNDKSLIKEAARNVDVVITNMLCDSKGELKRVK